MAGFALAASISPGPVNLVSLAAGVRYGFRAAMWHVTGATLGFTVLLLLTGFGLHELIERWPQAASVIKWAGVAFLLYMAYRLATDDGELSTDKEARRPSAWAGAAMQWLNPKAWLAAVAGIGIYCAGRDTILVWQFAAIYCVICYASLACWAYAGVFLRRFLHDARRMRVLNRAMAVLIAASVVFLL